MTLAWNRHAVAGLGSYRWDMADDKITVDPAVMAGAPCIRGIRVPVATVVAMIGDGMTPEEIVHDLPYLERADIDEALRFAAEHGRRDDRHTP